MNPAARRVVYSIANRDGWVSVEWSPVFVADLVRRGVVCGTCQALLQWDRSQAFPVVIEEMRPGVFIGHDRSSVAIIHESVIQILPLEGARFTLGPVSTEAGQLLAEYRSCISRRVTRSRYNPTRRAYICKACGRDYPSAGGRRSEVYHSSGDLDDCEVWQTEIGGLIVAERLRDRIELPRGVQAFRLPVYDAPPDGVRLKSDPKEFGTIPIETLPPPF